MLLEGTLHTIQQHTLFGLTMSPFYTVVLLPCSTQMIMHMQYTQQITLEPSSLLRRYIGSFQLDYISNQWI